MRITLVIAILCLSIGLASVASADISGPWSSNTVGYSATEWNGQSLLLPQFNSALGTLYQVDILIDGGMKTILNVINTGEGNSTGRTFTTMTLTVTDGAGVNMGTTLNSDEFHFTDLAPNTPLQSDEMTKTGQAFQSFLDGATLAAFTGTGNYQLLASTLTDTWIGYNGGNAGATQSTQAQATAYVTYHYTTVPEPSSLLALFTGICGVVGVIRRRR